MELKPVGLVTCAALPALSPDDKHLVDALGKAGLSARPVVWDDPAVDWADHSGLLIRSVWDYHEKPDEFSVWLDNLERRCVPVFNALPTLRWNMSKTYLRDCGAAGVPVVPTVWLEPGEEADLDGLMFSQGWEEAVLKPVVSAGARRTHRLRRGEAASLGPVTKAVGTRGAMLQPFLQEVQDPGELSFVFIDGLFCHAVLKTPAKGDFRVQEDLGGKTAPAEVSEELSGQALRALDCVKGPWLYARVDAVVSGGSLMVSELELLEPSLYFSHGARAATRLAEALKKRL